ncbi:hypothetical protein TNCV_1223441 [Trichonephila clavipes]|nr:hypothetical protein TNCV_1223441 [Trichonephila clavipes]
MEWEWLFQELLNNKMSIRYVTQPFQSDENLRGRTGTILRPSSVPLKSKTKEINRLQLAVKLPWAIFFESVVEYGVSFSYMFSHSKIKNEMKATRGLLATDHVILNHGQMTWTTPELAPPCPNYHTTPMGGRFSSRQI